MNWRQRLCDAIPSPDYMKLWAGEAISWVGDSLGGMALSVMLLKNTGKAMTLSIGSIIGWLPVVLLGPLAGVLLDRFSRRWVMVLADLARGLTTLGLAFLVARGHTGIVYAYGWMLLMAIFRVPYTPATMAIIPSLVKSDQLQRANSLQSMAMSISGIIGPALAGIAIAAFGAPIALTIDAASFFLSASLVALVRPQDEPQPTQQRRQPALRQFNEGLKFFAATPLAVILLLSTIIVNASNQAGSQAMQVHVLKTLAASPSVLGLIGSASAAAMLLGSVVLYSRKKWPALGRILLISTAAGGLAYLLVALPRRVEWLPFIMAGCAAAGPFMGMAVSTIYQQITPPELRGRVFAVRSTLSTIMTPITTLAAGWAIDAIGTRVVLMAIGVCALVAVGCLALTRTARTSPYFRAEKKEDAAATA